MTTIKLENLSIGYQNKILCNINGTINQGDYVCVIGENGTGKSTLIKTILGIQKPISGSIKFLTTTKDQQIGYVTQQSTIQKDFPATVKEIVYSGLPKSKLFHTKQENQQIDTILNQLSLTHLKKESFSVLSGGQQQRVLLARALASSSTILVLDEPTAGLDTKIKNEFYTLIEQLNKKQNMTIIMISHDLDYVNKHASHIIKMNENTIIEENLTWK